MKSTLKMLAITGALIALIIGSVLLQNCALSKFISGQKIEMFSLTIGSEQITVQLPPELSKDKFASMKGERCYNARLCVRSYAYNVKDRPGREHVSFWFTCRDGRPVVFAIVWLKKDNMGVLVDDKPWLYDREGLPVSCTGEAIQAVIDSLFYGDSSKEKEIFI